MICLACPDNIVLSDTEATRKFPSGEYVDLCDKCYETIRDQVLIIESMGVDEDDEQ